VEAATIYLSGCITQALLQNPRPDLGIMLNPGMGTSAAFPMLPFLDFGADNGCFAQGDRFDAGNWLEWLAGLRRYRKRCLFAVAPDVLGDAIGTLACSRPYLATIRQLGYPAAFVTQDGCTSSLVPWDDLDALFVGGTDAWKLSESSYALVREAKLRGKKAHMGRVNSLQRLRACAVSLFDSADGTYLKFGPDVNLPKLYDWLDRVNGQGVLEEAV
jgi:hypothetical protein